MVQEAQSQLARAIGIGASVPIGQSGLVHIWGRNDMATHQMVGMFWEVKGPDGILVERYGPTWEGMTPGEEDDFIGGRFPIDKPGDWMIAVTLLMNPDSPVIVDSYDGLLCRVAEEEYAGTITRKELEYDGNRGAIPVQ